MNKQSLYDEEQDPTKCINCSKQDKSVKPFNLKDIMKSIFGNSVLLCKACRDHPHSPFKAC